MKDPAEGKKLVRPGALQKGDAGESGHYCNYDGKMEYCLGDADRAKSGIDNK
jgi:hypothetical protein